MAFAGIISPQDWGLPIAAGNNETMILEVGTSLSELEERTRAATYEWLLRQFDPQIGAFHGFYRAGDHYTEPPQTVNLIAPWQLMAAYDRYGDPKLLQMAQEAANFFYNAYSITHPMSVVAGGVHDGVATDEVWTKFTAEEVMTCLGLFKRTGDLVWKERAIQAGKFLIQARRHGFAPRYRLASAKWESTGWDSWGRVVEANLLLWQTTDDQRWYDEALRWGEYALRIQAGDGAYYLIDGEYYNTDLAADEMRALVLLHELTGRAEFLEAARRFADWHLAKQDSRGAWPLTIDCEGNVVISTVGPGDIPNLAISLLQLYHVTHEEQYLKAAYRAFRYSLSVQATPNSNAPYGDDDRIRWGFWSWDPYYDYTMSGDQATHHVRGMWFLMDYWSTFLAA